MKDSQNINIEVMSAEGDREINLNLKSKLRIHKNPNSKLFRIVINSDYLKTDVSKNLAGEVEEYRIQSTTNIALITDDLEKKFTITENFTMKNFADDFEEVNYEKRLKKNIAESNYRKILLEINKIR
tara:strand:+ start:3779 stop:4159 length:381 start_codon:yes stop_codon:yes gene_type:complete